jgi:hypothetical protein
MNENKEITFSDEDIIAYLLGTASTELTERFDELSITSDEFSEALAAAESDLVDSYVNGELPTAERSRFEQHYLRSRSASSKLSFAKTFREFGSRQTRDVQPSFEIERRSTADDFFVSFIRYLRWGFAVAAAALVLFVVWMYFGSSRIGDELSRNLNSQIGTPLPVNTANASKEGKQPEIAQTTNEALANESIQSNINVIPKNSKPTPTDQSTIGRVFAFALSPPLRSSNSAPQFAIPKEVSRVSVRLELESDEFKTYQAKLIGPSNNEIWRSESLRPVNGRLGRSITAIVPAPSFRNGNYRFSVTGVRANGELENVGDYPFRVVQ